jgi:translocation protein SEC63
MAGSYKYDEEGGQFLTFILTFVLLFLLPLTYSALPSSLNPASAASKRHQSWFDARGQKTQDVKRINRRSLTNPKVSKKIVLVALGWSAVAFLVQKLANTAATSSHTIYDPFAILGISSSLPEKAIKKHYKKLSVKL